MLRFTLLLSSFENQLADLRHKCQALSAQKLHEALFDDQLFKPCIGPLFKKELLQHYLNEISTNIHHLKQKINQNQEDQVQYLLEKIANQLVAIAREIATHELRVQKVIPPKETPYEMHCRYLDYERRLVAMKRHCLIESENATDAIKKIEFEKKLAAVDRRIDRCRQAIAALEDHALKDKVT